MNPSWAGGRLLFACGQAVRAITLSMWVSQRLNSTSKGRAAFLLLTACMQMLSYGHTMAAGAAVPAAAAGEKQEQEEPAAIEEDGVAEEEGKSATPAAAEAGAALREKLSQTTEVNMLDLQLAYLWRVHRVNYYVGGGLQYAAAQGSRLLSGQLSICYGMLGLCCSPLDCFLAALPSLCRQQALAVHLASSATPDVHLDSAFHGWDCSDKHRWIHAPCVSCFPFAIDADVCESASATSVQLHALAGELRSSLPKNPCRRVVGPQ